MSQIKKLILSLLCFAVLLSSMSACSTDPITMPKVTGFSYSQASQKLQEAGLSNIETRKTDNSLIKISDAESWVVLAQDPAANVEVTARQKVVLTVKSYEEIRAEGLKAEEERAEQEAQKALQEKQAAMRAGVESVVGQSYIAAYETLSQWGITIKWLHSASKQDFTEQVLTSIEHPNSEFDIEWIIVEYKDYDEVALTVTLMINTQENINEMAASAAAETALRAKLNPSDAWEAAERYGKNQYPYGFELHSIMGLLAQTAADENTWFLKATCTVTNMYGAEMKGLTCEAKVTGTSDNPIVVYFIVY